MKNCWVGEENGIKLWPQLYLTDISQFYGDELDKKSLHSSANRVAVQARKSLQIFY